MEAKPDQLSARETLALLESAGLGREDADDFASWNASWRRLPVSGLREAGWDIDLALHAPQRCELPIHFWNAWRMIRYDSGGPASAIGEDSFASIDWEVGSVLYVWHSPPESNPRLRFLSEADPGERELWYSLHFDRIAIESLIRENLANASQGVLQDHELAQWIKYGCKTENSKEAWQNLTEQFGAKRRGKKQSFERVWTEVKGQRGRGRPPKSL